MKTPLFVTLHGSYGSPEGNWFPALKQRLERLGQEVIVPQFPVDNWDTALQSTELKQTLDSWMKVVPSFIDKLDNRQVVVVAHSLGPLFALHMIEKFKVKIDCLIAVSPFLELVPSLTEKRIAVVNQSFYKNNFDFVKLKELIADSYVLYSSNDPFVPKEKSLEFADKIGAAHILVRGAGHMNAAINMNEFPLVLELCKSRLDLTLYQKYLAHRAELFTEDTAKYHTEGAVNVSSKDMFDEGIFKFRNLQKYGFCTLPSNALFWDNQSQYMQESRQAAMRLGTVTRVILVNDTADLERPELLHQIELDIASGFHMYVCPMKDVESEIGAVDFGIWDDEYVCIVTQNDGPEPEVLLTSRQEDMPQAHKWKNVIMEHAAGIKSLDDVKSWAKQQT
jgi:predicted alpha/beta hydrolase family esterase